MGAPRFNAKCNEPLPTDFRAALESEASHREVALRFGMTPPAIRYRRAALFPGRSWGTSSSQKEDAAEAADYGPDGLTTRQREVSAMPVTPLLLAELAREKPRRACAVCWRDVKGLDEFACARFRPGTKSAWCQGIVARAYRAQVHAQERAKASLFGPPPKPELGPRRGPNGALEQVCSTEGCGTTYFKGRGGVGDVCMRCYVARRKGKVPGPRVRQWPAKQQSSEARGAA